MSLGIWRDNTFILINLIGLVISPMSRSVPACRHRFDYTPLIFRTLLICPSKILWGQKITEVLFRRIQPRREFAAFAETASLDFYGRRKVLDLIFIRFCDDLSRLHHGWRHWDSDFEPRGKATCSIYLCLTEEKRQVWMGHAKKGRTEWVTNELLLTSCLALSLSVPESKGKQVYFLM